MTISTTQDSLDLSPEKITEDVNDLVFAIEQKEAIYALLPTAVIEKRTLCQDLTEILTEDNIQYNALISSISVKSAKTNRLKQQTSDQENNALPYTVQALINDLENEVITEKIYSDILQQSITIQTAEHIALLEALSLETTELQNIEPEIIVLRENLDSLSKEILSHNKTIATIGNIASTNDVSPGAEETSQPDIPITQADQNKVDPLFANKEKSLDQPTPFFSETDVKVQLVIHKNSGKTQEIDIELLDINSQSAVIKTPKYLRTHIKVSLKLNFKSNTGDIKILGKISKKADENAYSIKFKKHQDETVISLLTAHLDEVSSKTESNEAVITAFENEQQIPKASPIEKQFSETDTTAENSKKYQELIHPDTANVITDNEDYNAQKASTLAAFSDEIEDGFKLNLDDTVDIESHNNNRKTTRYVRDDIKAKLTIYKLFRKTKPIDVELLDISCKGVLVSSPSTPSLKPKTKVTLELIFDADNRPFTLTGTVVRKTIDKNYGIQFSAYQDDLGNHLLNTQTTLVFK
ncbi:MAG: PilZ domain-containing protein [Methylococcaceae bacterium]